jgi:site-specific recombinase XerC
MTWLKDHGGELEVLGPDELVKYQLDNRDYTILDLVQEWVRGIDGRVSYKRRLYSTILSFFLHNRASLPDDPSFKIRGDKPPTNGNLKVEDLRRVLDSSNSMYRALFLCLFQAGMGMGELQYWNRTGLGSLLEQLSNGTHPIRIDLPGRKHNRNVKPYYTFLGKDAIEAVRYWLKIRPDNGETAIFLTRDGTPPAEKSIRDYWMRHLRRLGLVKPKLQSSLRSRYGKNLHEIRATFRSRWRPSGVDVEVAEFFMGHNIDSLGYDKSPWQYPDWFKAQYLAAEPWLNILSDDPEKIPREDVKELQLRIHELERERNSERDRLRARTRADNERDSRLAILESRIKKQNKKLEYFNTQLITAWFGQKLTYGAYELSQDENGEMQAKDPELRRLLEILYDRKVLLDDE